MHRYACKLSLKLSKLSLGRAKLGKHFSEQVKYDMLAKNGVPFGLAAIYNKCGNFKESLVA